MHRIALVGLVLVGLAAPVAAQTTALPGSKFAWTQSIDAPTAQAYSWKLYNDGAVTGVALAPVTCVAGTPATTANCSVPMPAYTPGPHTITITATNAAGESPKSDPLTFTMVAIPAKPGTPGIQ